MRSPHWEARRGLLTIQFLPCPANTFPAEPTFPNHHHLYYSFCPIWVKLKKKEFIRIQDLAATLTWSTVVGWRGNGIRSAQTSPYRWAANSLASWNRTAEPHASGWRARG